MKPKEFKRQLRLRLNEELDGYIKEAEHQDGKDYWLGFVSVDEAVHDFGLAISTEHWKEGDSSLLKRHPFITIDDPVVLNIKSKEGSKHFSHSLTQSPPAKQEEEEAPTANDCTFRIRFDKRDDDMESRLRTMEEDIKAPTASHARVYLNRKHGHVKIHSITDITTAKELTRDSSPNSPDPGPGPSDLRNLC